ncbi:GntR family transcriptional regulator [Luteococcus sp. Sow4_B9]|uniref:GntR family transcriptional regulator n=1 Tax=Luteococcus sp. Sow4_B9 TaxID=3438792 RepID=UPI003F9A1F7A
MSLPIRVDDADPTPPYEQLRAQIAMAIATGQLTAGARLPPVRQLARDLGIAPGTVARTYKELEQAGLVATARGAGTSVIGPPVPAPHDQLRLLTREFIARARSLGADSSAIHGCLAQELGQPWSNPDHG